MPPPNRKQPSRTSVVGVPSNSTLLSQANGVSQSSTSTTHSKHYDALMDFQARRVQRRLEDLERTNPTDIPAQSFIPANSGLSTSTSQTHLSGSPIPNAGGTAGSSSSLAQGKKKMSSNVRRVLYGRKGVKDWLDELPPTPTPPYLTSTAPPPNRPPRKLCSSCGYKGAYKCPKCGEFSCGMECAEVHRRDGGCGV